MKKNHTDKRKLLESIEKVKEIEQSQVEGQIYQLEKTRKAYLKEIDQLNKKIDLNQAEKSHYSKSFYQSLSVDYHDEKVFLDLEFSLARFDKQHTEISQAKAHLFEEVENFDEQIQTLKQMLKEIIKKKEKYAYIRNNYLKPHNKNTSK